MKTKRAEKVSTLKPGEPWVLQKQVYEHPNVGNFIQLTPTLQAISRLWQKPVPVFFESAGVASLFTRCNFIASLGELPAWEPSLVSIPPRSLLRSEFDSDAQAYYSSNVGTYLGAMSAPCIPRETLSRCRLPKELIEPPYVVISNSVKGKNPFPSVVAPVLFEVAKSLRRRLPDYKVVIIGEGIDYIHTWRGVFPKNSINLVSRLSLLARARVVHSSNGVVSTDTEAYHLATACRVPVVVLMENGRLNPPPFCKVSEVFFNPQHQSASMAALNVLNSLKKLGGLNG